MNHRPADDVNEFRIDSRRSAMMLIVCTITMECGGMREGV